MAASDALGDRPVLRYRLTNPTREIAAHPFLGIATIMRSGGVTQRADGSLRITGERVTGRACTSEEGFHVLGEDAQGRVASDLYVGLGYSVEAKTCAPAVGANASAPAR